MKKLQSAKLQSYLRQTFTLQLLKVTRPHASSGAKDDDKDGWCAKFTLISLFCNYFCNVVKFKSRSLTVDHLWI